jgi:hypothetical protein
MYPAKPVEYMSTESVFSPTTLSSFLPHGTKAYTPIPTHGTNPVIHPNNAGMFPPVPGNSYRSCMKKKRTVAQDNQNMYESVNTSVVPNMIAINTKNKGDDIE